jgi:polysaccharide export outer membrane protein
MLRRLASSAVFLTALALLIPAGGFAQESDYGYTLRAGDRVDLKFFTAAGTEISEITGERIIDRDGNIFLPYIGSTGVSGLNAIDVRELLEREFSAYYSNPVVDVTASLKVNVTGAVPQPGSFFLDPTSTIIDAVSEAGGTGTGIATTGYGIQAAADASEVRLVRDGETSIIDLTADNASLTASGRIRSGDWIYVPPAARSEWRDTIEFISSIVTLIAATVGLVLLFSG